MTPKDIFSALKAGAPDKASGDGMSRRNVLGLMGGGLAGTVLLVSGCSTAELASSKNTSSAQASGSPSSSGGESMIASALAAEVAKRWPHGETVWPGLDYKKHNIVLIKPTQDFKAEQAWLINTSGMRELSASERNSVAVPPAFDKIDFEGMKSVSLSTTTSLSASGGAPTDSTATAAPADGKVEDLYRVATHELVHFYHQDSAVASATASRNTAYPIDPEPRYMRRMLLRNLQMAFRDPAKRDLHLGYARYWQDSWMAKFPKEASAIREFDIREGTAKYIENYMMVVDPSLSKEALAEALAKQFKESDYYTSVDLESYELGYAAGIVMDQTMPKWKENFYASKKTPAELLLSSVTARKEEDNAEVRAEVEKRVQKANSEDAPAIKTVDDALSDTSIAFLRYSGNLRQLQYQDSYTYKGRDVLIKPTLELAAEGGTITVKLPAVFNSGDADSGYIAPLPKGSYSFADGVLTVTGDQVSGKAKAKKTQESGREVFTITLTN